MVDIYHVGSPVASRTWDGLHKQRAMEKRQTKKKVSSGCENVCNLKFWVIRHKMNVRGFLPGEKNLYVTSAKLLTLRVILPAQSHRYPIV
jgi:hypothetical protein